MLRGTGVQVEVGDLDEALAAQDATALVGDLRASDIDQQQGRLARTADEGREIEAQFLIAVRRTGGGQVRLELEVLGILLGLGRCRRARMPATSPSRTRWTRPRTSCRLRAARIS